MSLTLPSAPANFYSPSLDALKTALTSGRAALITAAPTDIEAAWAEVGVAADTTLATNRGTFVVGHADIETITGPVLGPEESVGENGYKLQFAAISEVPVYIDGTGTTTAVVVGIALVAGVSTFAGGANSNVRYIPNVTNLTVTDGGIISIPAFEIILNYSEDLTP